VESYDFLRQYELESGSRVCWCTLSSCVWAAPLSNTPTYPISAATAPVRPHC